MSNTPSPLPEDRIPVIVGVGEIVDRPAEIAGPASNPLALLAEALRRAEQDSGGKFLGEVGSLDIVNFLSWRYQNPARAALRPARHQGPRTLITVRSAGESPIRYLHEAAQTHRGAASAASPRVCGAEAQIDRPLKRNAPGVTLPWTPFAHDVAEPKRGAAFQKPMAGEAGACSKPVTVYPLYEAATSAHWGQTPARGDGGKSGTLWSTYFGRRVAKSQCMAKAAFRIRRNHHADAGQPADRVALYKTDGGPIRPSIWAERF